MCSKTLFTFFLQCREKQLRGESGRLSVCCLDRARIHANSSSERKRKKRATGGKRARPA